MSLPASAPYPSVGSLPAVWRDQVSGQLQAGEAVVAWLQPDLDPRLQFGASVVVLTDRRLLGWNPGAEGSAVAADTVGGEPRWGAWPLQTDMRLVASEESGLGTLELLDPKQRLAYWRYTHARAASASSLASKFQLVLGGPAAAEAKEAAARGVCPSCGRVLKADETECPDCAPSAVPPAGRSLLALAHFARPHAGLILLGLLLTIAGTAASLISPYLTMPLVRALIPTASGTPVNTQRVAWCLAGMAGAAVVAWLLAWARTFVLAYVSELVSADLRNRTYSHLQKLSLEFFGGRRTGDLISRVGSDSERICNFLSSSLVDFVADVLMFVMTAAILLYIDPVLAIVVLLPLPLIGWLIQRVRFRLRHGFGRSYAAWAEMISVLADTIPGVRVVKAFAQEQREVDRFRATNDHVVSVNNRVNRVWSFFEPVITLLTEVGLLIVWLCGAWRVAHGHIQVEVLVGFVAYISRFYGRLQSMSRMFLSTQRVAAAAHRMFEILDRVPSVPEATRPVIPGRLRGQIEISDIWFQYGARPVIKGISLFVQPGELIGLVGPSGAGKSTLINLICRFYDVVQGSILVDGTDIRSFPIEQYRRNIGIVLQDPFLFFGTIAENIAYGRPDATREEIVAAAHAAHAHEFILKLPDGYDSLVGERGQSLSGGERQRISIARALLIDPRILILDEATSSVDTETEWHIQKALENLTQGRTTIAIAHRLSTLRRADRLVVVEDGQISETGRHDELLSRSGTYARLYRAQLRMSADEEEATPPAPTEAMAESS